MEDAKVAGTSSILNTEAAIDAACIVVGDPLECLVLPRGPEKMISSSFDDCMIPFYECLFTII